MILNRRQRVAIIVSGVLAVVMLLGPPTVTTHVHQLGSITWRSNYVFIFAPMAFEIDVRRLVLQFAALGVATGIALFALKGRLPEGNEGKSQ